MRQFKGVLFLTLLLLPIIVLSENVFVTKTGHKYHLDNCKYLQWSKISIDKSEAIKLGYASCSVCVKANLNKQSSWINTLTYYNDHKHYIIPIVTIMALGFSLYFIRKRRTKKTEHILSIDLTDLELSFLKRLLLKDNELDTYSLNDFLGLKGKSMDAQRKTRARFIKSLNDKLYQLHQVSNAVLRINDSEDKRVINYALNPKHIQKLSTEFKL